MRRRWQRLQSPDLWAVVSLSLWPLVYFWPVAIGAQVFFGHDIPDLFYPLRMELATALAEGRLPLWTTFAESGFPIFAEGHIAALYPLNLLLYRLLPVHIAFSYSILFHFAWGAVGLYLFCRSAGRSVAGALLAGFVWESSGFALAHVQHITLQVVASWLPWLLLFQAQMQRARRDGRGQWVLWFALTTLSIGIQFVSGYPQLLILNLGLYSLLGIVGPALWNRPPALALRQSVRPVLASLGLTLASMGLGMGLAAAQLLPAAELLGFSVRSQDMGLGFFTSLSLPLTALPQFLFPFAPLGAPTDYNMEFWGYLGVMPLVLSLLALRRREAQTWFFFLLAGVALAFALGESNPLYSLLYYVPVFNRFRVPARFLFLFTLAVCFLAATGLDELGRRLQASPRVNPGLLQSRWPTPSPSPTQLALPLPKARGENSPFRFRSKTPRFPAGEGGRGVRSADASGDLAETPRLNRWTLVVGALSALAALGVIAARDTVPAAFWLNAWKQLPWLWLALAAVSLFLLWRRVERSLMVAIVLGASVVDLSLFGQPFLSSIDALAPLSSITDTPRAVQEMDSSGALYRILTSVYNETFRLNHTWISGKQSAQINSPLALQRNEDYTAVMSPAMLNLLNVRYYARISNPTPEDKAALGYAFDLDLFEEEARIPPTRTAQVEIISYADQIKEVADGFLAGQVTLHSAAGAAVTLPIHVGQETADWAYAGWVEAGGLKHSRPAESLQFPGYLVSLQRGFEGNKYIARYTLPAPLDVTSVTAHSNLPPGSLVLERISLIDEQGQAVSLAPLAHHDDLSLVFKSHAVAVLENLNVLPRALLVHQAEIVPDDQVLPKMRMPDWSPTQVVFLSQGAPLAPASLDGAAAPADVVALTEYRAERVTAQIKTARSGYLVLADSWYPGWQATVDGRPAPVERADYIFRAVAVPPGEHTVVFEFRSGSFYAGAALSVLSALVLAGLTLIWRRRRPGAAAPVRRPAAPRGAPAGRDNTGPSE